MDSEAKLPRRAFLGTALGATVAAPLAPTAMSQNQSAQPASLDNLPRPAETRKGDMLYRALGQTGETVSVIGVGGSHVGQMPSEQEAIRLIRTAINRGVTFMDNSRDYNNGTGADELRMGKALRDGYRQKVFLMTKVDGRTRQAAAQQLDQSLQRLQADHIDLLQFHETIRMEDPDRFFAEGGALEAFLDAKKAGKIRFIGFTGHKDPAIHLRMIEMAKQHRFHFDAVLFPSNVMDYSFRSFVHQVMPVALREGIGVQTMKPMGGKFILDSKTVTPAECLQYALSWPTSVVIHGMDKMEYLNQTLDVVKNFRPLTHQQVAALAAKAQTAAMTGKYELFKTTAHFDSTAKNPQWLGENG